MAESRYGAADGVAGVFEGIVVFGEVVGDGRDLPGFGDVVGGPGLVVVVGVEGGHFFVVVFGWLVVVGR